MAITVPSGNDIHSLRTGTWPLNAIEIVDLAIEDGDFP